MKFKVWIDFGIYLLVTLLRSDHFDHHQRFLSSCQWRAFNEILSTSIILSQNLANDRGFWFRSSEPPSNAIGITSVPVGIQGISNFSHIISSISAVLFAWNSCSLILILVDTIWTTIHVVIDGQISVNNWRWSEHCHL